MTTSAINTALDTYYGDREYIDGIPAPVYKPVLPTFTVISTQYCENYGAHDWDGEGECPQYWKYKGGSEYIVAYSDGSVDFDGIRAAIEHRSDYAEEYIIGTNEVVLKDGLTRYEREQAEYGGTRYYEPRLYIVDGNIYQVRATSGHWGSGYFAYFDQWDGEGWDCFMHNHELADYHRQCFYPPEPRGW